MNDQDQAMNQDQPLLQQSRALPRPALLLALLLTAAVAGTAWASPTARTNGDQEDWGVSVSVGYAVSGARSDPRLEMELGYGFNASGSTGASSITITPHVSMTSYLAGEAAGRRETNIGIRATGKF